MKSTAQRAKRHHHVWRHYLTGWSSNGEPSGTICCWQDGRRFKANPSNLGVEQYFYDLRELEDSDDDLIRGIIAECGAHLRPVATEWHKLFKFPTKLATAMGEWPALLSADEATVRGAAVALEEEIHCQFENEGLPILTSLRSGTAPKAIELVELLPFLTTQFTRTKAMERRVAKATSGRVDRVWQVLRHVFAANISTQILLDGAFQPALLQAPDGHRLIAGDQPVINPHGTWREDGTKLVTDMELYYPVSPKYALLVSRRTAAGLKIMSEFELHTRNASIARSAHLQVYASAESDLSTVEADRAIP